MKKVSLIFGTRPEAIKLCPLVLAFQGHATLTPHVCVTGQHREMLDQVLEAFQVTPDVDLALMQPDQTLGDITSRAVAAIDSYLIDQQPDMVIVQGDTTTAFCAALCAFYHKVPVGHVEAGLRTWNRHSPFPEEMNRVLVSRLADLHFAPTETSKQNLLKEAVPEHRIVVTGNTVIDALQIALERIRADPPAIPDLPTYLARADSTTSLVLITGHRRENFGGSLANICRAIAGLARRLPETEFVYPVHPNPSVQTPVYNALADFQNVHLTAPLGYLPFIALMERATLLLTDSGGLQEEAPSLGKPVLVMRDVTERPEAMVTGTVKLVGTDENTIIENVTTLLTDPVAYEAMTNAGSPYGDGTASTQIVATCNRYFRERR